jgi:hypothetical protein
MLKKEVLQLLGRKGKTIAGDYYRANEKNPQYTKDWFTVGFRVLVTDSVNHALKQIGNEDVIDVLSTNTANAVGSAID